MKDKLLQSGTFSSDTFKISFGRKTESAIIERIGNDTDLIKIFSHKELEELRDLLWELAYNKLLVNEVIE